MMKEMSRFFYYFSRIFLLFAFVALASCSKFSNVNQRFEDQYGMQVESMRMAREMAKFNANQADIAATNMAVMKNNQDWRDDFAANRAVAVAPLPTNSTPMIDSAFYAYEDRALIDFKKNNEVFMPRGGETYGMAQKPTDSLPDDMFVITYNLEPHPPFIRIGDDFDAITIPDADAYQVKTEPTNKPYLLVDAASVQNSIDKINHERSDKDIVQSEEIISEIKRLKRENTMLKADDQKVVAKKKEEKKNNNIKAEVIVYHASNDIAKKQGNSIFDNLKVAKQPAKN